MGFIAPKTALYYIGYRTKDMIENVLGDTFKGMLMSDGYLAYRFFLSIKDSVDKKVSKIGG